MYLITWITTHLPTPEDGWVTDSGRLNLNVVTHPASSPAQDTERSPAENSVLTTILGRLRCLCSS